MASQILLETELLPARADVLHAQVFRLRVTLAYSFGPERLRAVGTHEALFSIDHRRSRRPVEILQTEKYAC